MQESNTEMFITVLATALEIMRYLIPSSKQLFYASHEVVHVVIRPDYSVGLYVETYVSVLHYESQ